MKCRNCGADVSSELTEGLCGACRTQAEKTVLHRTSDVFDKADRETTIQETDAPTKPTQGRKVWSSGENCCVWPMLVARSPNGEILVLDSPEDFRLVRFDTQGNCLGTLVEIPAEDEEGGVEDPQDLCVDARGGLYVPDGGNDRISVFRPDGAFDRWIGLEGSLPGQFLHPSALDVDADGFIYVADTYNYRIQRISADGLVDLEVRELGDWGNPQSLVALSVDPNGNIWIADAELNAVLKLDSAGKVIASLPDAPGRASPFVDLTDVHCDATGLLYISDARNQRIQRVENDRKITGLIDLRGGDAPISGAGNIAILDNCIVLPERQNDRIVCIAFDTS